MYPLQRDEAVIEGKKTIVPFLGTVAFTAQQLSHLDVQGLIAA